ncbi:DNA cytosine methyltransferase [Geminocystis sp.]|uniref:DNA cytosine methyltransferase n=1 Tax=Geminocystis sp. TaxID=2664100 RepID=UPI003593FCAA
MKVISLFCGCGGLDLGFERANYDIIWANDLDKNALETYQYNFDITKIKEKIYINFKLN